MSDGCTDSARAAERREALNRALRQALAKTIAHDPPCNGGGCPDCVVKKRLQSAMRKNNRLLALRARVEGQRAPEGDAEKGE